MKKKTIVIVAGGDLSLKLLPDIRKGDYIIGADYGAFWLLSYEVTPDEAIGDFDSVSKEEMQLITECVPLVSMYPKEKDYTDLELALERAIQMKPKEIVIYGATGGRLDHTLAGILLLEAYKNENITIIDENNELSIIYREKKVKKITKFSYCSFISISQQSMLTLKGFKYPLTRGFLNREKALGVSNEIINSIGSITVHKGTVLCIQSRG